MPRFRVSYTFVDRFAGEEDAIRKAVRDLPFSTAFDPADLNGWRVCRTEDGGFLLEARRTLVDEIFETSERAALRKFLCGMDLPDALDLAGVRVECLDGASPGQGASPFRQTAPAA
jgi:hypothetical protein